ncbi:MAG: hypothetical protein RIA09_16030 [Hoeflea sp.]|jgi:hypothetical protein|uniref:hypothetical protein n=1 Tax=Hoeflea sp. TaxID=1940281 RepID=UPI0032EFAA19
MKEFLAWLIGGCVVVGVAAFGSFHLYAYFSPKYEGVRRDTQIESRAYSEATVRELYRLKRQWEAADSEDAKATIAAAARHEFSIFPQDRLPADLKLWMTQIN